MEVESEKATTAESCERLVRDRFPEGLVRQLDSKFPELPHSDVEEAVAGAIASAMMHPKEIKNLEAFLTTAANNKAISSMRAMTRRALVYLDADDENEVGDDPGRDPTGEEATGKHFYEFLVAKVKAWQSVNLKSATLLVLEAALLDEPITSEELAEELEVQLDREVLPATARQWRKRGLDRLRAEIDELDYEGSSDGG